MTARLLWNSGFLLKGGFILGLWDHGKCDDLYISGVVFRSILIVVTVANANRKIREDQRIDEHKGDCVRVAFFDSN